MKNTIKTNGQRNDGPKKIVFKDVKVCEGETADGIKYVMNLRRVRNA